MRGKGKREGYLKWLAKMIDMSLRHNGEATRELLADKVREYDLPTKGAVDGKADRG